MDGVPKVTVIARPVADHFTHPWSQPPPDYETKLPPLYPIATKSRAVAKPQAPVAPASRLAPAAAPGARTSSPGGAAHGAPPPRSSATGRAAAAAVNEPVQLVPCNLEAFIFGTVVGVGSFGRVAVARHVRSGTTVAIKMLSKARAAPLPVFTRASHPGGFPAPFAGHTTPL